MTLTRAVFSTSTNEAAEKRGGDMAALCISSDAFKQAAAACLKQAAAALEYEGELPKLWQPEIVMLQGALECHVLKVATDAAFKARQGNRTRVSEEHWLIILPY